MTIFRLAPIDIRIDDEKWSTSMIQEAVWVEARDDLHARHLVEAATLKMVDVKPGRLMLFSPWLDEVITSCFSRRREEPSKGTYLDRDWESIGDSRRRG